MTVLYKLNNTNRISWWKIEQQEHKYTIDWGQDLNTINQKSHNHNIYTLSSPEEAEAKVASLIREQVNRNGYSTSIPNKVPDMPMLAQKWEQHKKPFKKAYIQPKLDGFRCIATSERMTTRKMDLIVSCPHIQYILEHLPSQYKLDGELYIPGTDLQTMQSYVNRQLPHRLYKQIEFHVFDLVNTEKPFQERMEDLHLLVRDLERAHEALYETYTAIPEKLRSKSHLTETCPIKFVPTFIYPHPTLTDEFELKLKTYHKECVDKGYEGVIIRDAEGLYEPNYRSPSLLKYKHRQDDEFLIVDISEGYGKTGIFVCKTVDGNIFEATPAWPNEKKRYLLRNKEKYIGRWLTVEYEKLSRDGTPLKPTAKNTRVVDPPEKENGTCQTP